MMKQKWGESLGANFSFGLIQFLAMIVLIIVPVLLLAARSIFILVLLLD
jgi:hypothetical protein